MSGLTFRLKSPPGERLDVRAMVPSLLRAMDRQQIAALPIGSTKRKLTVDDVFEVTGDATDTVTIQLGSAGDTALDYAGAEMADGTLIIDGSAGLYTGRKMRGGKIEVRGNAGGFLASGMSGGMIHVTGSAGDNLGSIFTGDRFGMIGGTVVVGGDIGARAGDKMRRGTVIVKGKTAEGAGTRMIGGTIWAEGGFGPAPGFMMRRGTLIGSKVERLLPTFADCGRHDLLILRILSRHLKATLGDLAPAPMPLFVQKIAGDMATIGKGEILLPAG